MKMAKSPIGSDRQRDRLEEEISYMETRLEEIGFEGDCAYEKAISKFFRAQIDVRRRALAEIPMVA